MTDVVIWAAFAVEYLIRLVLTPDRGRFVLRNIPDLLVVVVPVLQKLKCRGLERS